MYIHPVQIIIVLLIMVTLLGGAALLSARKRRLAGAPDEGRVQEIESVKERVQVLERIVTDKEHSLSREIERLRDH